VKYKTLTSLALMSILTCCVSTRAVADITALVAIEPTARKDGLMLSRQTMASSLSNLLGQPVNVTTTDDLTDAMRSTRSGGYDVFIGPAQVIASAMGHGYDLVGSTDGQERFVLVGRTATKDVKALRQGRIYLPQQDSIYTYLARGMLTASGLSFKDLNKVEHAHYPQAGLIALKLNFADATVVHFDDWDGWNKANPGIAHVLAESGEVPGGFSVAIKKDLSPEARGKTALWFETSTRSCGMKPVAQHADPRYYKKVAELGTFTPTSLPGATVVNLDDVKRLMAQGVHVIDTRVEKEYKQKHILGAISLPYGEKSLKDVAYDSKLDDFSGLKTLRNQDPVIFHCNGPECWKSYKASRAAIASGFSKVYWYRGGMPDWEAAGQPVSHD